MAAPIKPFVKPLLPEAMAVTQSGRIVVLREDKTLWQRVLDPQNFTGGEKFVWQRIDGPPTE